MDEIAKFELQLSNAEGLPANEPKAEVNFVRPDGTVALKAQHVAFPPERCFSMPAWPTENALYCQITSSLYRMQTSQFFFPQAAKPEKCSTVVMRNPTAWSANFRRLADLPPRFKRLQALMENSANVVLKHGPSIGDLSKGYNALAETEQGQLAKMALLNIYSVLSDEHDPVNGKSWIDYMTGIALIDRERVVAEVDGSLWDVITALLADLEHRKQDGFFTESASMHYDNIPAQYSVQGSLITIKKRYQQGNVQWTMAKAVTSGRSVVLLDCDMDENSNVILHTCDLFKHIFTGGTHPIDMHEFIVYDSAMKNDGNSVIDLGYTLEPDVE